MTEPNKEKEKQTKEASKGQEATNGDGMDMNSYILCFGKSKYLIPSFRKLCKVKGIGELVMKTKEDWEKVEKEAGQMTPDKWDALTKSK